MRGRIERYRTGRVSCAADRRGERRPRASARPLLFDKRPPVVVRIALVDVLARALQGELLDGEVVDGHGFVRDPGLGIIPSGPSHLRREGAAHALHVCVSLRQASRQPPRGEAARSAAGHANEPHVALSGGVSGRRVTDSNTRRTREGRDAKEEGRRRARVADAMRPVTHYSPRIGARAPSCACRGAPPPSAQTGSSGDRSRMSSSSRRVAWASNVGARTATITAWGAAGGINLMGTIRPLSVACRSRRRSVARQVERRSSLCGQKQTGR